MDNLVRGKLRSEALVEGPEEADVRDLKENHGETLQAKTKSPALPGRGGRVRGRSKAIGFIPRVKADILDELLVDHTTAQHLHPLPIEKDLKLEGRIGEGKVLLDPAELDLAKEGSAHAWVGLRSRKKRGKK